MTNDSKQHQFDLFVIGGGSGGVRAARIAAGHGARVAIAEESRYGGTCVIRGCVPKKFLVYGSRFPDEFHDATGYGWTIGKTSFDWKTLIANKDREISRLEGLYRSNLEKAGVKTLAERATILGPHRVRLASGREITATTLLIATGGRPVMPGTIDGAAEHAIVSDDVFDLAELPPRTVIVGGGYIALEFAGILNGLGSKVTVVFRRKGLLYGFDDELATRLDAALQARGIEIRRERNLRSIARRGDGTRLVTLDEDSATIECDAVLMATGRAPNTSGLGLESIGINIGPLGRIPVDEFSRTEAEDVFAIGDVTDRMNLTPVAIREGHAFADSRYGNRPWIVDHANVPTAVFTTPELGTVGLTEAEAVERHGVVDVFRTEFRPMKSVLAGGEERMVMKLLVDVSTDRLLGAHLLGPDSAEMVQVVATLLRLGATKRQLDETMPLHPSAAEELVTIRTASVRRFREHNALDIV